MTLSSSTSRIFCPTISASWPGQFTCDGAGKVSSGIAFDGRDALRVNPANHCQARRRESAARLACVAYALECRTQLEIRGRKVGVDVEGLPERANGHREIASLGGRLALSYECRGVRPHAGGAQRLPGVDGVVWRIESPVAKRAGHLCECEMAGDPAGGV